jgi:hypothetical protein
MAFKITTFNLDFAALALVTCLEKNRSIINNFDPCFQQAPLKHARGTKILSEWRYKRKLLTGAFLPQATRTQKNLTEGSRKAYRAQMPALSHLKWSQNFSKIAKSPQDRVYQPP